ncbi:MAG: hypothetical protein ACXAD7_01505 [Candidatus Kariarchaeaceae archaeon]|jgi:hypothetical protein
MVNNILDVDEYLRFVRNELQDLPDCEGIIQELRNHIWDLAAGISSTKFANTEDSFIEALKLMELPEVLAQKFIDEDQQTKETKTMQDRLVVPASSIPEKRISVRQFSILGIVASIILSILSSISVDQYDVTVISDTNGNTVTEEVTIIPYLLLGLVFILATIGILYKNDEWLYKKQVSNLRQKFTMKDKSNLADNQLTPGVYAKPSNTRWQAISEHIDGLIEVILYTFVLIVFIAATIMNDQDFFTDNWYYVGFTAISLDLGARIIRAGIRMIVGQVRISRLISAIVNFISGISRIILVIFYPFNFDDQGNDLTIQIVSADPQFTSSDALMVFILSVLATISFLLVIYDFMKFGLWGSHEQKSLVYRDRK